MMRAYASLKRRIMDGEFSPGTRLDPARLRDDLAASATPIRDALHRMTGEGLVESWQNEGFRVPQVSEAVIRDGYEWSRTLVRVAIDGVTARDEIVWETQSWPKDYAEAATSLLLRITELSSNHEIRRAMINLCDRTCPLRIAEVQFLPGAADEVEEIERAIASGQWSRARVELDRFHDARLNIVPRLADALRRHGEAGR